MLKKNLRKLQEMYDVNACNTVNYDPVICPSLTRLKLDLYDKNNLQIN